MKRIIKSLLIIMSIILLSGCTSNNKDGEELLIELSSNPSTGYNWTYNISNKDIISIEEDYDDSICEEKIVGCGGYNIYKIKALKKGETTITFTYSFPNKPKSKEQTAVYVITIDKDLKIKETHEGSYFLGED